MSNKTNNYFQKNKKLFSDLLELGIVVAFLFMIVCIYVPRAIWDDIRMAASFDVISAPLLNIDFFRSKSQEEALDPPCAYSGFPNAPGPSTQIYVYY